MGSLGNPPRKPGASCQLVPLLLIGEVPGKFCCIGGLTPTTLLPTAPPTNGNGGGMAMKGKVLGVCIGNCGALDGGIAVCVCDGHAAPDIDSGVTGTICGRVTVPLGGVGL